MTDFNKLEDNREWIPDRTIVKYCHPETLPESASREQKEAATTLTALILTHFRESYVRGTADWVKLSSTFSPVSLICVKNGQIYESKEQLYLPPDPKIFFRILNDFISHPDTFDLVSSKYKSLNLKRSLEDTLRGIIKKHSVSVQIAPLDLVLHEYEASFRYKNVSYFNTPMWILKGNDSAWAINPNYEDDFALAEHVTDPLLGVRTLLDQIDKTKDEIAEIEAMLVNPSTNIVGKIERVGGRIVLKRQKAHLLKLYDVKRQIEKGKIIPNGWKDIKDWKKL